MLHRFLLRTFSTTAAPHSAVPFGASARRQVSPRVAAWPYPSHAASMRIAGGHNADASATAHDEMIAAASAPGGNGTEQGAVAAAPLILHGKLAAEPRFEGLLRTVGTLSAPGVRVEVCGDS
ncbi:hypothetical protein OC835_004035 [Tilletia horrida]|uniref:Uncharacterized protein n=1 Tax=Tilletia horrida TaxID=155126 RepID=A0AAN6JHD2_9BASI|nr:hypothetical protein OC842_007187 [Tilletia horrida]KAK0530379.1 hypothetical protein OC835_004035 [Tilletia horrida]KAK0560227.1 hypothetical protein OC844_003892 [Tilletia horrida]